MAALQGKNDTTLPPEAEAFVREWLGEGWSARSLHGDASVRGYYRIIGPDSATYVLAYYPEQVRSQVSGFLRAYEAIAPLGRVPEVVRHSGFAVAQRDVGDQTLFALLERDRDAAIPLYREAIDLLVRFQATPGQEVNPPFTTESFLVELEMTHEYYVRRLMGADDDGQLVPWFRRLADKVAQHPYVLCHRDYHGQNLHVLKDGLYMIDYQDLRMGPDTYDLASLLRDRGVADLLGETAERELIDYYRIRSHSDAAIIQRYYETLLQRSVKILGTFSKQPITRGKVHYLEYIPPTIRSIRICLEKVPEFAPIGRLLPLDFSLENAHAAVASLRKEGDGE